MYILRPQGNSQHKLPFKTVGEFMGASLEKIRDLINQYSQTN